MNTYLKGSKVLLSLSAAAILATAFFTPVVASANACTSANTVMYIVAHEDDALLFQNPDIQHDITAGKCVSTVFLTAGDSGQNQAYWSAREDGARAATAFMAGVGSSSPWTLGDAGVAGHSVKQYTLTANPKITLVFFRMPDGNIDGNGFAATSFQGLQKLYQGVNNTVTTVDGATTYSRIGFIDALTSLMTVNAPSRVNTQDFVGAFGDGDHSDHHATALFVVAGQTNYLAPHTLYSYEDYNKWIHLYTDAPGGNVVGDDLTANHNAFFAYAPFDNHVCQNESDCTPPSDHAGSYFTWLSLMFTNGSQQGGDVCPNVSGHQSSVPEGYVLADGQCVSTNELSCTDNISTTDIVSDTSETLSTGGNAVATFIPYSWTADIPGATWVWNAFHVADPVNGETLTLTRTFTVAGTPSGVSTLLLAADDNYVLTLNGNVVATVTELNNYTSTTSDTYNVSSYLQHGVNTLVVTIQNEAMGIDDAEVNPAGLLYKLTLSQNSCVPPPPDVCPNIDGLQTIAPEGYQLVSNQCVPISSGNGGGGSSSYDYWGCTNAAASNFNSLANKNDGTCKLPAGTNLTSSTTESSIGEVLGASTTAPELPLPVGCTETFHNYLGYGKKNNADDVSKLQQFLNDNMGANLPVTGFFGKMTKSWVKKFQTQHHNEIIKPWYDAGYKGKDIENGTGYVYKTTKRQINLTVCTTLVDPLPDLSSDIGN